MISDMNVQHIESRQDADTLRRNLEEAVNKARSNLEHIGPRDERKVCLYAIQPFLTALGWPLDVYNGGVKKEFRIDYPDGRKGAVDYALRNHANQPIVVIEAKAKEAIIGNTVKTEIRPYFNQLPDCHIAAWTNGSVWHWFCLDYTNALSLEPFITFDVTKANWLSPRVFGWLFEIAEQYPNADTRRLLFHARKWLLTFKLDHWWHRTLEQPSKGFLDCLWKENKFEKKGSHISQSMRALVKQAWTQWASEQHFERPETPVEIAPQPKPDNDNRPPKEEIDSGRVLDPNVLLLDNGRELTASKLPRAWRTFNHESNTWRKWFPTKNAKQAYVQVAEWLLEWHAKGLKQFLEVNELKWLSTRPVGRPSAVWHPICNEQGFIYVNLNNAAKSEILEKLAALVKNAKGQSPKVGVDFEFWLPRFRAWQEGIA